MSAITIYTKTGEKRYDAPITQGAMHIRELMKEHYVQLGFNAPLIEFSIGDYIIHEQEKFTLQELPKPERAGSFWKYDIQFHSFEANWKNCVFFFIPETGAKESEWTLTSNPKTFVEMAARNINRFMGTNIQVADDMVISETQSITFTNVSVWDGLAQIAETFDTEWWFDGQNLHLCKYEYGGGLRLDLHKEVNSISGNKGDQSGYATRIYPYGSTRNIVPETTSTATNSILNNRLKLAELEYIDSRDDLTKEEIVEAVVIFEDIYPRMKDKKISSVRVDEQTIDGTKQNVYFFKIANLGFDPKPLILKGMDLSVKFESGNLNGREHLLKWDPDTQEFEILNQNETESLIIPNESLCPDVNDTVVLFNLKMPDYYKAEAQAELLTAAQEYILESSKDRTVYTCETNPVHCSNNNIDLNIGQRVLLQSIDIASADVNLMPSTFRQSRIQRFEKKLYNKYICTYQVGDNAAYSRIGSIEREAREAKYAITGAIANGSTQIPIITRYDITKPTDFIVYSSLRSRDEFAKRKEADSIKEYWSFEKGIKLGKNQVPGLLGGSIDQDANAELKSLTLREFLNVPELRYNRVSVIAGEQWSAPGGGIIEEVNIVDSIVYLKLEKGELATIAAGDICKGIFNTGVGFQTSFFKVVEVLSGMDRAGFIYQLKPGTTVHPQAFMHFVAYGNFTITSRQASAVQTREYLRFMAGVNTWDISFDMIKAHIGNMVGMTINGVDFSGYSGLLRNFYFDGMLAQLAPAIADSEQNTKDYVDDKTAAENLALQNFIDNTYTTEMLAMQAQIDGQVESYFFQQDPTLSNAPANGWNTTALKESHLNDTYTNLSTGKSWRWSKDGTIYSWVAIADTATEKALQIAGQAKDTADSKRRTFVATPYPPYDLGDLWVTSGGELMKCVYARASGSYLASDWAKATKYTDDSAVDNMVIGGRNYALNTSDMWKEYSEFKNIPNETFLYTDAIIPKIQIGDDYLICFRIAWDCFSIGSNASLALQASIDGAWNISGPYYDVLRIMQSFSTDGTIPECGEADIVVPSTMTVDILAHKRFNFMFRGDYIMPESCFSVKNFRVITGNKPVDWKPALEDIQSDIDEAKNTGAAYNSMGEYSSTAYYTGSKYQRDVVWIANPAMATGCEYFVAKITAGTFTNIPTSDKTKWESIGAQFSSIATDFLLARKIKGDEIDTNTLISENVKTSRSGRRIEISNKDNSMQMLDDQDNPTLIVKGDNIPSVSEFIPASINPASILSRELIKSTVFESYNYPGIIPSVNYEDSKAIATFTIPEGYSANIPIIKLSMVIGMNIYEDNAWDEVTQNGSLLVKVLVNDYPIFDKMYIKHVGVGDYMINETNIVPSFRVNEAGTYTIKLYMKLIYGADFSLLTEGNAASVSISSKFSNDLSNGGSISISKKSELTQIFNNGFGSKYASDKYFIVLNAEGQPLFETRNGLNGLRLSANGLERMTDGKTWVSM